MTIGRERSDLDVAQPFLGNQVGAGCEQVDEGVDATQGEGIEAAFVVVELDQLHVGVVATHQFGEGITAHHADALVAQVFHAAECGTVVAGEQYHREGQVGLGKVEEFLAFRGAQYEWRDIQLPFLQPFDHLLPADARRWFKTDAELALEIVDEIR